MVKKINHVAVVVPELDEAMNFWVEALGLPLERVEKVREQEVEVAFLHVGESHVELVRPLSEESGIARYLQKRGPGMHHICFEVDDIEAVMARLKTVNVPLIDEKPRTGSDGRKYAFVHPKGTGGVLVELYQLASS